MCNVRATTAEDLEALSAVYIDAFAVVDPSEKWTSEKALALLKFFLDKQPDLAFVAVEDGEIGGGICGLVKPWWDGNHLVETELFVAPWCQKRGIATLLFSHFLESAIAKHDASVV